MGPRAGSLAFLSLTSGQLLHALSCRSEKHSIFDREKLPPNRYLNMALAGSFGLQALSMFVPGLRSLLGIAPIGLLDGAVLGASAVVPLLVNEATKKGMGKTATKENEENTGISAADEEEILIASPA
jgi:Ca2+-transporting ATPase